MECSIVEFYEMLKNHDWYHEMSDDHSVWEEGRKEREIIKQIVEAKGLDYKRMFDAFELAMFSGEPWGTAKVEIPRLNEYI